MKDGKYELEDIKLVRLSKVYDLSVFDCNDSDLNEFIKKDSFDYQENKMANTLLLIHNAKVIGFFSLCADAIKLGEDEKEESEITKPLPEFPAVKIARLAVDKEYQKKNLGGIIIQLAIGLIRNRISPIVAARFITVDSYYHRVKFYEHFDFAVNEHSHYKKKKDYVSMRLDLLNPPKK